MIDHTRAVLLMDQYKQLLTLRQQEILSMYFEEDLSLSEIQEILGISRAAIQNAVSKAASSMENYEEKLHLLQKNQQLEQLALQFPQAAEKIQQIIDL